MRQVVKVPVRIKEPEGDLIYPFFNLEQPHESDDTMTGSSFIHPLYGEYKVIKRAGKVYTNKTYFIQFTRTGYMYVASSQCIKRKVVRDVYHPSIFGGAHFGGCFATTPLDETLKRVWKGMIDRCYRSKSKRFPTYGGAGVFVCNRWKNYANFRKDVEQLPNWEKKVAYPDEFTLDKDYYGSNCYSPDTCVWLSSAENNLYREKFFRPFLATYSDGREEIRFSTKQFAIENASYEKRVRDLLDGVIDRKFPGIEIKLLKKEEGYNYRYIL